ncbi:hypothetical protein A2U01_0062944, partial [Trifolium medium]|nr:hypothetical protein [Trifolium medium]
MFRRSNQRAHFHRHSSELTKEAQDNASAPRTKCELGGLGQPLLQKENKEEKKLRKEKEELVEAT